MPVNDDCLAVQRLACQPQVDPAGSTEVAPPGLALMLAGHDPDRVAGASALHDELVCLPAEMTGVAQHGEPSAESRG
jgi:hypothetical protein